MSQVVHNLVSEVVSKVASFHKPISDAPIGGVTFNSWPPSLNLATTELV